MTDRDDALRRQLGWTTPAESSYEPEVSRTDPPQPAVEPTMTAADPPRKPADPYSDVARDDYESDREPPTGGSRGGYGAAPQDEDRPGRNYPESPTEQYPAPPRFGSGPQPSFRESGRYPTGSRRETGPLHSRDEPPPSEDPTPPAQPRVEAPAAQQWSGGQHWLEPQPGVPGEGADSSFAERIRYTELIPQRRTPPGRGWRRLVYRATFGLVHPGPSPDELHEAALKAKIRAALRGNYKIGVMGKGGVGKTTVAASVGSIFAELRQHDHVVALDADTAFGKLGSRVDPKAPGSYWDLTSDEHLYTFADVRSRVGNNAAGLFVLAGESTPARRRVLDPGVYREAAARLDRYFPISIIDCSSTMDSPVTQEVLRDLDALIVVSSPWVDGAAAAGQTMDWLANRGLTNLLQRTVVVLNDSDGHADRRTRAILNQQFTGHGQVVIEVPFDPHLRPGGVIDGTSEMSSRTRRRFLEIAAALAEHFTTHERARERR